MTSRLGAVFLIIALNGCGGGAGSDGGSPPGGCEGACEPQKPTALSVGDVQRIIAQAVQEAQARESAATIAVVDRVGNVLGVFRMQGAARTFTISSDRGVTGGLENVDIVPSEFAAISKAITGAYLSSEGNAFTTRTASQIVQENFNVGEINSPGGPLFGVQFSSLSCSDITRHAAEGPAGPKNTPLGLSADPGGLPLYKAGKVVGGVGVIADGRYGLDSNVFDIDESRDELIAVAATRGFDAPADVRAERISVDGRTLRYVDSEARAAASASAPPFATLPGMLVRVANYSSDVVVPGTEYGTAASGIRPNSDSRFAGLNSFVLDDGTGVNRYPPRNGTDGLLTEAEVARILIEAITIANRTRAQIRRPLGSPAQVSIAVVDSNGVVVGLIRTPDGPVFGIDVSVQKARAAVLFSNPAAASELSSEPAANYLVPPAVSVIGDYVTAMQAFIPGGTALKDGIAYSNRSIGNLARPFFPDGINGVLSGPLSKPFPNWSPFNDGLQLDLVLNQVIANILRSVAPQPMPLLRPCTTLKRAPNGIQIFAGSVPIYRGAVLVGAIGISGDGIDQDDMIAFLGLANAGVVLGNGIGNAPRALRADQIGGLPGRRLRYVNCPVAPFLDTTATNVCDGF